MYVNAINYVAFQVGFLILPVLFAFMMGGMS